MNDCETKIRDFIILELKRNIGKAGISASEIDESCSMLESGLVDSFGFIALLSAIEKEFNVEINFSELDPSEFVTFKGLVFQCAKLVRSKGC